MCNKKVFMLNSIMFHALIYIVRSQSVAQSVTVVTLDNHDSPSTLLCAGNLAYVGLIKTEPQAWNYRYIDTDQPSNKVYYLPKKSWPILYSMLLCKTGQNFLDIQYTFSYNTFSIFSSRCALAFKCETSQLPNSKYH